MPLYQYSIVAKSDTYVGEVRAADFDKALVSVKKAAIKKSLVKYRIEHITVVPKD